MNIRKVVIPVAGWGTRSLPASKNIPKEMLPVYNKPVVQYVVEEAIRAGVEDVIFVTNRDKSVIEDHFDYNLQLEGVLERAGKLKMLKEVRDGGRDGQHHVCSSEETARSRPCGAGAPRRWYVTNPLRSWSATTL